VGVAVGIGILFAPIALVPAVLLFPFCREWETEETLEQLFLKSVKVGQEEEFLRDQMRKLLNDFPGVFRRVLDRVQKSYVNNCKELIEKQIGQLGAEIDRKKSFKSCLELKERVRQWIFL